MHQIGVVGLSYRHAGIDEVARLSIPKAELAARLRALRAALGVAELLYLGTCNRVELLFATHDGEPAGDLREPALAQLSGGRSPPGQAARLLRAWAGESALEHVLLLACGLDSAQAGEREIALQLRASWEAGRAAGTTGPMLDRLMGEALAMANRVRRLQTATQAPSLADLAAARVLQHLTGRVDTVALVGVSPMTRRCGLTLHRAGVPLTDRESFARTRGGVRRKRVRTGGPPRAIPRPAADGRGAGAGRGRRRAGARQSRAATAGSGARRIGQQPLAIDFGVPPNVDPDDALGAGIVRIGMSELVQEVQEGARPSCCGWHRCGRPSMSGWRPCVTRWRRAPSVPQLAELRDAFERIAADELERALTAELRGLTDSQRDAIGQLTSRLARRLAHLPIAGMRAAAAHAGPEAIEAFFDEARLHRGAHAAALPASATEAPTPEEPLP